jgi:hypothetical protein
MAALTMALAVATPPQVLAVRLVAIDGRAGLRILTSKAGADVDVQRLGDDVLVTLGAEAPLDLVLPAPAPPVLALTREASSEPGRFVLRVRVRPQVPSEARRDGALVTVFLGERPASERRPSVEELYRRLFPTGLGAEPSARPPEPALAAPEEPAAFRLGPMGFRPHVQVSYVNADTATGEPPQVVRDQYLQVQPGLSADSPLGLGRLTVSYEPRLRSFSSTPAVKTTTHWLNAALSLPLGSRLQLGVTEHFSKGALEATEVDPGKEYFFDLGGFRRSTTGMTARVEVGPRLSVDLGGTWSDVKVDDDAAFFSYRERGARGGLSYELGPNLRLALAYVHGRIPRPEDRPEAEATSHGASLSLSGELMPLTTGRAEVGLTSQTTPNAGPGGTRYRGLTSIIGVRRELGYTTAVDLSLRRSLDPSAFEDDGFYIATSVDLVLTVPGPWRTQLRGGAGYQWSDYRTKALVLDGPRADRIFAWYAGLVRTLGEHARLRLDYRHEHRRSNLPGFDIPTSALVAQVDLGWLGGGATP